MKANIKTHSLEAVARTHFREQATNFEIVPTPDPGDPGETLGSLRIHFPGLPAA